MFHAFHITNSGKYLSYKDFFIINIIIKNTSPSHKDFFWSNIIKEKITGGLLRVYMYLSSGHNNGKQHGWHRRLFFDIWTIKIKSEISLKD